MSRSDASHGHRANAMPFADDTRLDDDNEWIGFTVMDGELLRAALAVFVPSIALIAYLYAA